MFGQVSYVGHSMGTTSFLAMASSSSASAAAVLSTVQVSCDWWTLGHVTPC